MKLNIERKTSTCKKHGETVFYLCKNKGNASGGHWYCVQCHRDAQKKHISHHPEMQTSNWLHRHGLARKLEDAKDCSSYLGIYIAERVLSKFFDNIQRMPINNHGYDFVCGKGFKIDVKSACLCSCETVADWVFRIRKNTTPDYFLCLAFDDRSNLEPMHVWLIPSEKINHFKHLHIPNVKTRLARWSKYERPLERVVNCCNEMRNGRTIETLLLKEAVSA